MVKKTDENMWNITIKAGVGNFYGLRAVLKILGPLGPHITNKLNLTVTFSHQILLLTVQEASEGCILPADNTLANPELKSNIQALVFAGRSISGHNHLE